MYALTVVVMLIQRRYSCDTWDCIKRGGDAINPLWLLFGVTFSAISIIESVYLVSILSPTSAPTRNNVPEAEENECLKLILSSLLMDYHKHWCAMSQFLYYTIAVLAYIKPQL